MIGGLQGEFGDLDIKYLKQKISKYRSQISGSVRRNSTVRGLRNFAAKGQHFRSPRLISQSCKNLSSTWSDRRPMDVTPSFQLRIVYRLKYWIFDFLSFETTYSMHKLNSRSAPKVADMTVIKNASC